MASQHANERAHIRVRRRRSTIGLDYGTHSTKVVHRVRNADAGRVVRFDEPAPGYSPCVCPSAIRKVGERLLFGTQAKQCGDGIDIGSLKTELVGSLEAEPEVQEEVAVLTIAYLAWVLRQVLASDSSLVADDVVVQLSAPTTHAGQEALRRRYLQIAQASYKLAFHGHETIHQGITYSKAADLIKPLLAEALLPLAEQRCFIMPETVAPIVSLQREPYLRPGMYLVADMGAATTEMTVLLVNDESIGKKIVCYHDSTEPRGGNELAALEELDAASAEEKLHLFLGAVKRQAANVWWEGYKKDRDNRVAAERWRELNISLSGGATLHHAVTAYFEDKMNPVHDRLGYDVQPTVSRHTPSTLECDVGSQDLSLYAVANGLSIHTMNWSEYFYDYEVETLAAEGDEPEVVQSYLTHS